MIEHMFDPSWSADDTVAQLCEQVVTVQDGLREQEWRELVLAARWADLHGPESVLGDGDRDGERGGWSGGERLRVAGGGGTPEVAEFACAELGLLMGVGPIAAGNLIRDAVDLQHRHPLTWALLSQGHGRVWKARQVARMVHAAGLTREQAWVVDAAVVEYVDTLTWSAFTRLVEARIIEADPAAAEARREAAALDRFVSTGRSNEHGLAVLVAKASAGEVIYFVAVCDRVAQILALHGDSDPVDVRRSKALAILANPAAALALLEAHTTAEPHPDDPDPDPDVPDPDPVPDVEEDSGACEDPDGSEEESEDAEHGPVAASVDGSGLASSPVPAGPLCVSCGGVRVDPEALRPRAVLHVRISAESLRTGLGVASCEGTGPVTVQALADLLGHHRVTVRPVLDLRGQVPVDAYEVPHAMREALRLARPSSVFPWTRSGSPGVDLDHTRPYVPVGAGGSPRQTRIGNLGPLTRFGHRVKTFGRGWQLRQPSAGVYLWRTPHGYWFRVDDDGTRPLGRDPDLTPHSPPRPGTAMERAFADLLAHA
jgi:hypothetical protein